MTTTQNETPGTFRPVIGKYGLKEDYVGAHVLTVDNQLAEIKRTYSEILPADMGWTFKCELYHFNGEKLGDVELRTLRILDRTFNG